MRSIKGQIKEERILLVSADEGLRLPPERGRQIARLRVVTAVLALDGQKVLPRVALFAGIEIIMAAPLKAVHLLEAARERVKLFVRSQVPFPNEPGHIARAREQLWQRDFAHRQSIIGIAVLKQHIVLMPEALLVPPGQQAGPR